MGHILEVEQTITERIQQRTQPPDGLQSAGSDAHFALFLFPHIRRTAFGGIGGGAIGDGVAPHDDTQGEDEVIE